jgi:hypothetical protein
MDQIEKAYLVVRGCRVVVLSNCRIVVSYSAIVLHGITPVTVVALGVPNRVVIVIMQFCRLFIHLRDAFFKLILVY